MEYSIKAKPTYYNNRLYRSRLEARWAAYFDLAGWDYEYEPMEINGRNPDFIISCKSKSYDTSSIIVEVKPREYLTKEYMEKAYNDYSKYPAHGLFLTESPFNFNDRNIVIGQGWQYINQEGFPNTEIIDLEMKCVNDFGSEYMSFDGMVFGITERKIFTDESQVDDILKIRDNWINAGNEVMFLKP